MRATEVAQNFFSVATKVAKSYNDDKITKTRHEMLHLLLHKQMKIYWIYQKKYVNLQSKDNKLLTNLQ